MKMQQKPVKLSLMTAKKLVRQELGLAAYNLKATEVSKQAPIFYMEQGSLQIKVENDWFSRNGRIRLSVVDPLGSSFYMYYDPLSLTRDFDTEWAEKIQEQREQLETWVYEQGPEVCMDQIRRIWNER